MSWIKIEERLPENGVEVLVYSNSNRQYVAWLNHGEWIYSDCCGCRVEGITHWKKLPNGPNHVPAPKDTPCVGGWL